MGLVSGLHFDLAKRHLPDAPTEVNPFFVKMFVDVTRAPPRNSNAPRNFILDCFWGYSVLEI